MSGRHVREGAEPDGRPRLLADPAHAVKADHNGDPVCICGWDPARELPAEVIPTQMDALRQVGAHAIIEARQARQWTPPAD